MYLSTTLNAAQGRLSEIHKKYQICVRLDKTHGVMEELPYTQKRKKAKLFADEDIENTNRLCPKFKKILKWRYNIRDKIYNISM